MLRIVLPLDSPFDSALVTNFLTDDLGENWEVIAVRVQKLNLDLGFLYCFHCHLLLLPVLDVLDFGLYDDQSQLMLLCA